TVVAVILMVWSAVFLGQKILVEQALVHQTSWQDRLNARYVLMLRQGFEDCTLKLDDLELCDQAERQDIVKSARIIMGALWTLYPDGIRKDMIDNREYLIRHFILNGSWFSTDEKYREYVDTIKSKRDSLEKEIMEKYYKPYQEASALYQKEMNDKKRRAETEEMADQIEEGIDQGWKEYLRAQQNYQQLLTQLISEVMKRAAWMQARIKAECA